MGRDLSYISSVNSVELSKNLISAHVFVESQHTFDMKNVENQVLFEEKRSKNDDAVKSCANYFFLNNHATFHQWTLISDLDLFYHAKYGG